MGRFHGFEDFQNGLGMTPAFMEDFEMMARKFYSRWSLGNLTFEDFYGFAVEKMLNRMKNYNPAISQCSTFVFNLLLYEVRRLASKESHVNHRVDFDEYVANQEERLSVTADLVDSVKGFVRRAYRLGVYVEPRRLLADVSSSVSTPVSDAFLWLKGRGVV